MVKQEYLDKAKVAMHTTKRVLWKTAKYGTVFVSGVLVGAVCGMVLFLTIDNDPT